MNMNIGHSHFMGRMDFGYKQEFDCEWPPVWAEDKQEFSYTDINRCGLGTVYDYAKELLTVYDNGTRNSTHYPNMTVAREAWYASNTTCLRCR